MTKPTPDALRVVFAGGGTGGHIYPAIAMSEALGELTDGFSALFVGVRGGMDERILSDRNSVFLPGRGMRGAGIATKLAAPVVLADAIRRGLFLLRSFRPDVVVGTGGYASAAMVMAAIAARVPRVLQEQNSVPGLVNRRLARFADLVLLSFEASRRWMPAQVDARVVGNPLRRMEAVGRGEAAEYFGIDAGKPTVVIIGGSRGAHSLNTSGADAAKALAARGIQTVLLTGHREYDATRVRLSECAERVKVIEYLEDMRLAYVVADAAVARAGASSVFELASFAVPTVFVPYPYAADDHQRANVEELSDIGAAVVVPDAELSGDRLLELLPALLGDEPRRAAMARACLEWARPDAARDAAQAIIEIAKKKVHTRARNLSLLRGMREGY